VQSPPARCEAAYRARRAGGNGARGVLLRRHRRIAVRPMVRACIWASGAAHLSTDNQVRKVTAVLARYWTDGRAAGRRCGAVRVGDAWDAGRPLCRAILPATLPPPVACQRDGSRACVSAQHGCCGLMPSTGVRCAQLPECWRSTCSKKLLVSKALADAARPQDRHGDKRGYEGVHGRSPGCLVASVASPCCSWRKCGALLCCGQWQSRGCDER
jgi:hypothetical protein